MRIRKIFLVGSGIREIFLVETEIRRLWSPEYSSNNADLSNDWNPKFTEVPVKKNPESKTVLDYLT